MKVLSFNWRWVVAVLFLSVLLAQAPAGAQEGTSPAAEEKPTAALSTDILSQYVFRGVAYSNDSAVIQPSVTLGYKGFSFNVWGNFDTRQDSNNPLAGLDNRNAKWNETDITLSYSRELCPNFSFVVGDVYYSLTNAVYDANEVFGGLSYTLPWFTVAVTTYKEVTHAPGWWMQLDILKSIPLPCYGMSLDLGATFGYMILDDDDVLLNPSGALGDYSEFHSGLVQAALKIPVCKYVTVAPKVALAFPLTDGAADFIEANSWDSEDLHIYGGINITASF